MIGPLAEAALRVIEHQQALWALADFDGRQIWECSWRLAGLTFNFESAWLAAPPWRTET